MAVSASTVIIYLKNKRLQAINEYQKIQSIIDNSDIGVKKHLSKKREELDLIQSYAPVNDKNDTTNPPSCDKHDTITDSEPTVAIFRSTILLKFKSNGFQPQEADWGELMAEIKSAYPSFFETLGYIGVHKANDLRVSMLIKVGFAPGEIAQIMMKSFSSISSIRSRLYQRYFKKEDSAFKNWDDFIGSL